MPQSTYNIVGRVDYTVNDKTTLFGRYTIYSENDFAGTNSQSPYQGFNTGQTLFNQNVMLSVTHVFTPNVVMSVKGIYNRLNNQQPLGPQGVVPSLYFYPLVEAFAGGNPIALPGYLPFSPGNAIPFGGPQNVSEGNGDITWVKGAHTFKFGGSYIYTQDNRVSALIIRPWNRSQTTANRQTLWITSSRAVVPVPGSFLSARKVPVQHDQRHPGCYP